MMTTSASRLTLDLYEAMASEDLWWGSSEPPPEASVSGSVSNEDFLRLSLALGNALPQACSLAALHGDFCALPTASALSPVSEVSCCSTSFRCASAWGSDAPEAPSCPIPLVPDYFAVQADASTTSSCHVAREEPMLAVPDAGAQGALCHSETQALAGALPVPPLAGSQLLRDVRVGQMIGEGRYGSVWECEHRVSGARLACKQVSKRDSPEDAVALELMCLARAQGHPNVLRLEEVYESEDDAFILTECCNAGDLYDFICRRERIEEEEAAGLFRQVVAAVQHCHARGVVHRDIKPENILLEQCPATGQRTAKLADFGLATILGRGEKTSGWVGSKPYEAPEVVASQAYDFAADVFSLGVLLFSMLSGNWPSFESAEKEFKPERNFGYKVWGFISAEAQTLITAMLSLDPDARPSAADVLRHPWLSPRKLPKEVPVNEALKAAMEIGLLQQLVEGGELCHASLAQPGMACAESVPASRNCGATAEDWDLVLLDLLASSGRY